MADADRRPGAGPPLIIFDCNGVLVDSEPIAASVAAHGVDARRHPGYPGDRCPLFLRAPPDDMFADVEAATQRKLPPNFAETLAAAIFGGCGRSCATPHAATR